MVGELFRIALINFKTIEYVFLIDLFCDYSSKMCDADRHSVLGGKRRGSETIQEYGDRLLRNMALFIEQQERN